MYGYGIPLFYECYMKHELRLTGLDHPIYSHITANYTPDMISCYPGYWNKELESFSSPVV